MKKETISAKEAQRIMRLRGYRGFPNSLLRGLTRQQIEKFVADIDSNNSKRRGNPPDLTYMVSVKDEEGRTRQLAVTAGSKSAAKSAVEMYGFTVLQVHEGSKQINPRAKRKNAGMGDLFEFHGSYNKKSDALVKEAATAGSFIKFSPMNGGKFLVLTRRKKNVEFGEYQNGVFHPWTMRPVTTQKKAKLGKRKRPTRRPFKISRKKNGILSRVLRSAGRLGLKGAKATLKAMKQDARVGRAKITSDEPKPGSKAWYEQTRKQLPVKRATGAKHPMTKSEFDVFYENARGRGWNPRRKKNAKPARKRGVKGRVRARNGSLQDAAKLYEDFHGKPATKMTEYLGAIVGENNFTQLGQLVKLVIDGKYEIEFPDHGRDKVILASNPKGDQLYLIGGDQNVNSLLKKGEAKSSKLVDLGELTDIEYFTRKKFDGFQPVTYFHKLGEETGERPRLQYDPVNKQLHITGGAYKVKPEGIVN